MLACRHADLECVNPYELIRKYRCRSCGEVMMCACEEQFARRFLPHQLSEGVELNTQQRIAVTAGFIEDVCNTCRGLPEEAHPKAELYGASSKIRRYYWREIYFETTKRFGDWAESRGYNDYDVARQEHPKVYGRIKKTVVNELKALHRRAPKYVYSEKSQQQVLDDNGVEIVKLQGEYVSTEGHGVGILDEGDICSAEEFAARHFRRLGYEVLFLESVPFHVVFGVFTWSLIQDPTDSRARVVSFGDRAAFDEGRPGTEVWTVLPDDFGTRGYAKRRELPIQAHLSSVCRGSKEDLLWLFDYSLEASSGLRQYLWAHQDSDIERAREVISVLPVETISQILRYLLGDYWGRYTGWPDLLIYRASDFCFVEVKSSRDRLSEDQKRWITDNGTELQLPFKLVKIHRKQSTSNPSV